MGGEWSGEVMLMVHLLVYAEESGVGKSCLWCICWCMQRRVEWGSHAYGASVGVCRGEWSGEVVLMVYLFVYAEKSGVGKSCLWCICWCMQIRVEWGSRSYGLSVCVCREEWSGEVMLMVHLLVYADKS